MNVGLREAHDLAARMSAALKGGDSLETLEGYQTERAAEWRSLLEIDGHPAPAGDAPRWAAGRAGRILSCIPASGGDLGQLLRQIGLKLA
jgi:hypothetical protein